MSAKKKSFEDGLSDLEAIIAQIEDGSLSLEETVAAYEKGLKLSKSLEQQLGQSRGKLEKLMEDGRREELEDVDAQS